MADNHRIGIVTVTYNSAKVVDEFLDSLAIQRHDNFILYVVDNDSKDRTLERVNDKFGNDPRCVVLPNDKNLGVAVGNNVGIRRALQDGCSHVLLLNNDTVFGEDLLSGMIEAAERLGAPLLVPKIMFAESDTRIWCAGGGFNRLRAYATVHYGEGEEDRGQYDTAKPVEYAPTCCMLIKASVFAHIGLMDENFFVYYDDCDFVFRAGHAGHQLWYSPSPVLRHKVSSLTGGGLSDFSVLHGTRGKTYFIRKNFPVPVSSLWLGMYVVTLVSRLFSPDYGIRRVGLLKRGFTEGMKLRVGTGQRQL